MERSKRNIAILCAIVLVASMVIGGTLAYFSDTMTVTNPFTTAGNDPNGETGTDIEVTEPGYDEETSQDMYPGDVIVKDPTVKNLKGDSYVRFMIELKDKDTGLVITDAARANKILSTLHFDSTGSVISVTAKYTSAQAAAFPQINTAKFTLDTGRSSTGVYFYNYTSAASGSTPADVMTKDQTAVLFNRVVIPTDWSQEDIALLGNFDLVVTGQAIQAQNLPTAAEAFTALDGE